MTMTGWPVPLLDCPRRGKGFHYYHLNLSYFNKCPPLFTFLKHLFKETASVFLVTS